MEYKKHEPVMPNIQAEMQSGMFPLFCLANAAYRKSQEKK